MMEMRTVLESHEKLYRSSSVRQKEG